LREFSFDALTFPACAACNANFGAVEAQIKALTPRLLAYQPVASDELILLLDWLDKVRVGLWLGYLYLDKNPFRITPNFHIEARIGRSDRMVTFIRADHQGEGLSFIGPSFKGYQLSPTCFALRVNGLWLVNAAGVSLCSQRLGFPYLEPVRIQDDHKVEVNLKNGSGRIMVPVERAPQLRRSVSIYQPVFRPFLDYEQGEEFLESDWLKRYTANREMGYGKLFIQQRDSVCVYPDGRSPAWIPAENWTQPEVLQGVSDYVYRRIHADYGRGVQLASSQQLRKEMRLQRSLAKMADGAVMRNLDKSIRPSNH
jgi:hypothetical protein